MATAPYVVQRASPRSPAMALFDAVGSTRHSRQPSFDEAVDNEISDVADGDGRGSVRVTRFYQSDAGVDDLLLILLLLLLVLLVLHGRQLQIAGGTAGRQLRAPDRSGHCRTSSASSRSQWALPDLNCKLPIAVGNAGPQPRGPDPSGQRRTSTASSRSQWATPDLNRERPSPVQSPVGSAGPQPRAPDPSGHCRTSTAR
eukprot:s1510_g6.t1